MSHTFGVLCSKHILSLSSSVFLHTVRMSPLYTTTPPQLSLGRLWALLPCSMTEMEGTAPIFMVAACAALVQSA